MLEYYIDKTEKKMTIFLKGSIDEHAAEMLKVLHTKVPATECYFNLKDITNINSLGVRVWTHFLRNFQEERTITFEQCPPWFIMQINMIPSFKGTAKVESFYGTFYCDGCDKAYQHLFDGKKPEKQLIDECRNLACSTCGAKMESEEDDEVFFGFLNNG